MHALQIGRRRVEVAQRDRDLAVGEEALDVVDALALDLDVDEASERAALDPVRREVKRVGRTAGPRAAAAPCGGSRPRSTWSSEASDRLMDGAA